MCVQAVGRISQPATAAAMWCRWPRISRVSSHLRQAKSLPACSALPGARAMGAETMFDPSDEAEPPQLDAEEWRPMLSPTGPKADDFRHPRLGEPSEIFKYCNGAGRLRAMSVVLR